MVLKSARGHRVLVFNPNSSSSVTDTFRPILSALRMSDSITLSYWTCPTGPAMIKSQADMNESASLCLPFLLKLAPEFDGFLGACYADHPIVRLLRAHVGDEKPVVGIFDASVFAALHLISPGSRFGIITTGPAYEPLLVQGVKALLGGGRGHAELARFAGVSASGIGMEDLVQPLEESVEARRKITEATAKLLRAEGRGDIDVLCMGGVILAGMEGWVHEACEAELGSRRGRRVQVVDQLAAGMLVLEALLARRPLETVDYRQALK